MRWRKKIPPPTKHDSDRFISAQLCFGTSCIYGAIQILEEHHRSVKNSDVRKGWDSERSQLLGDRLEELAQELYELADRAGEL